MIVNGWTIALFTCTAATLFVSTRAAMTGVRVLRGWDHGTDTAKQIELEAETWLSSALMAYGAIFQMFSLLLLVLAADNFSSQLAGAMCATGAFTANEFGVAALCWKLAVLFLSVYWLLLHHFDSRSEYYSLTRAKYIYLLFLFPLLAADGILLTLYLFSLDPEVITSCCGVLFETRTADGFNLLDPADSPLLLVIFSLLALLLLTCGIMLGWFSLDKAGKHTVVSRAWSGGWLLFFGLSLVVVTVNISPYIYGLPSHRCPFDLLKGEYGYVGYPIYGLLFAGGLLGSGGMVALFAVRHHELVIPSRRYLRLAARISTVSLLLFMLLSGFFPLRYILIGGEI